jgi:hypothetical protein
MKKITLITVTLICLLCIQGCSSSPPAHLISPLPDQPLWTEVGIIESSLDPKLVQASGDIALEGFGQLLGVMEITEDSNTLLALGWEQNLASFFLIELDSVKVRTLGTVSLKGPAPTLKAVAWPQVLLEAKDEEGNFSWVLLDFSGDQGKIVWKESTWVPPGLRQQPVWFNGDGWYCGPIDGPYFTDILKGDTFSEFQQGLSPVDNPWPSWAGGTEGSHWYLLPLEDGSVLQNLKEDSQVFLKYNQELVWNMDNSLLTWLQDGSMGLVDSTGETKTLLTSGVVPQSPIWSSASDTLYFLEGSEDFMGTCCKELWSWTNETGFSQLFSLPGNWARWRLLAACDDAVLARAGDNGELLVYFDVAAEKMYELRTSVFTWQDGTLIASLEGQLVRLSPATGSRVILKDAGEVNMLKLVNQFLFFSQDGEIYIKQLFF